MHSLLQVLLMENTIMLNLQTDQSYVELQK